MPEEIEIETKEMQEKIQELHEGEDKLRKEVEGPSWIKWVGLSTALLAVFAAIGALQSGALVNEALINQIKASDQWAFYQAKSTKGYLFKIAADQAADHVPPLATRQVEYMNKRVNEAQDAEKIKTEAEAHEKEAEHMLHQHHRFAIAVTLTQIAIAAGAVAAITRIKIVWLAGLALGVLGSGMVIFGFLK